VNLKDRTRWFKKKLIVFSSKNYQSYYLLAVIIQKHVQHSRFKKTSSNYFTNVNSDTFFIFLQEIFNFARGFRPHKNSLAEEIFLANATFLLQQEMLCSETHIIETLIIT
jgi:hypothetical protein